MKERIEDVILVGLVVLFTLGPVYTTNTPVWAKIVYGLVVVPLVAELFFKIRSGSHFRLIKSIYNNFKKELPWKKVALLLYSFLKQ